MAFSSMFTLSPTAIARARPALSVYGDDDGHGQPRHLAEVAGDGLSLAALLGVNPRVGAGRIHEGEDGPAELGGELHHAQGLAVALGLGHAEVAGEFLFGVAALLVTHDNDGPPVVARRAGDDSRIVA